MFFRIISRMMDRKLDDAKKEIFEKIDVSINDKISSLERRLNERITGLDKKLLEVKVLRDATNKELILFKQKAIKLASSIGALLK